LIHRAVDVDCTFYLSNTVQPQDLTELRQLLDTAHFRNKSPLPVFYPREPNTNCETKRSGRSHGNQPITTIYGPLRSILARLQHIWHWRRRKYFYDWDWDAADTCLTKAATLEPGSVDVFHTRSELSFVMGNIDQAVKLYEQAVALDSLRTNLM
jgi:tetratricopeptide (TPR) repeat protein